MTVDEISPHKTDIFSSCRFIFLFCRLRLFRCALRISGETLTPYGLFTSRSGFLEFVVSSPLSCWFICHRKYKFSFSLLGYLSHASTFSNSSISAIRISPFQIPPAINAYPWKILVILSYHIDEFCLISCGYWKVFRQCTKCRGSPLHDSPNLLSYGVFPSARMSWTSRRKQKHSIESDHHFSSNPDCNNTADVPSFTRRTARSVISLVADRWGVEVRWFRVNSSQDLLISNEFSVFVTFGFCDGARNLCKLFCVSCEVLVLHG